MAKMVNINGHVVPAEQAHVSAYDHGFLYGDGVYETLRTYEGIPFLLDRHIARLHRSAERIRIASSLIPVDPGEEIRRTLLASGNSESLIRLVLTRGVGPFGYSPDICPRPSFLVYVEDFIRPSESLYEKGVTATIASVRRNPSTALDPHIKSINLLNNILAALDAHERGVDEAILLNIAGNVAEGSNTNVFCVRGDRVLTPPLSAGLLEGLTRDYLFSVCRGAGVPCEEQDLTRGDLLSADECFITSTTREIVPVVSIDGTAIGSGVPGPMTRRLLTLFREAARREIDGHAGG